MNEGDDGVLLRRYADERSEEAFTEVVRRHLGLVYSAALRQVGGNAATAEDVSQMVFAEMARKARSLASHPALCGWLYTITRRIASRAVRDAARRQRREEESMRQLSEPS